MNERPRLQARHRHGVPVLCALSAHVGLQEPRLRPGNGGHEETGDPAARRKGRRNSADQAAHLQRKPKQLSGGQRQRVAIGPRHRARTEDLPLRRAAVQSRRRTARANARRDRPPAPAARQYHDLRHPRPGRGHDHGRQDRGAERRQHRTGRRPARSLQQAAGTSSSLASSVRPR